MAGSNLRLLIAIALFFTIPTPSAAAPTPNATIPDSDRDPEGGRQRKIEELKSLGVDRHLSSLAGTVLDVSGRPVPNVRVELFIAGQLAATTVTEGNGYYDLRAVYDPADDQTVLLWFLAPDRSLMPKELVIHESKASQANGLISKCVPRASLSPGHQFRVYLFDSASRNKELAESDCLP